MSKQHTITMGFERENKRPNAPTYTYSTIAEMFAILNSENIDRALNDFCECMRASVLMREAMGDKELEGELALSVITWIDDEIL